MVVVALASTYVLASLGRFEVTVNLTLQEQEHLRERSVRNITKEQPDLYYSRELWRMRRRRYVPVGLFVGTGIASFGVSVLCDALGISGGVPGSCVLLGGFGMLLWSLFRYGSSVCPRCNKPFFSRESYMNAFSRKCMNCGLPLHPRPTDSSQGS